MNIQVDVNQHRGLWLMGVVGSTIVAALCLASSAAWAAQWTEEDFQRKGAVAHPYVVVAGQKLDNAVTVIGHRRFYAASKGDTFFDLARFYGLGYNELLEANPGIDPWVPGDNKVIQLPTEWVLPQAEYNGLVVNIPEMRLYYFHPRKGKGPQLVSTYPVGLGRDDWRTPLGKFRVRGKTKNPTWNIPESIQKERIADKGFSEKSIPGGSPDNPLGKFRIELTLPLYTIHGTNIPWGVGMQVSHGCIRLYPEDIAHLFPMVPVGTTGEFVYQPVKIGARGDRVYAEVHRDIYNMRPALYHEARGILAKLGWENQVDMQRLATAVEQQTGVPVDISIGVAPETELSDDEAAPSRPKDNI